MAVIITVRGIVKSIELIEGNGYYKTKVVLTDCFEGYFGEKHHRLANNQTLLVHYPDAVQCQVGDDVWIPSFRQASPDTWEIEGVLKPGVYNERGTILW